MERSLPCNEGATLFRMRPFIMVALLSFITRVASRVLCEVSVLLELFPANIAWKFSIRIINAWRLRGGTITLRQNEVSIRLLVAGEVRVGQKSLFTHLAVVWSLPWKKKLHHHCRSVNKLNNSPDDWCITCMTSHVDCEMCVLLEFFPTNVAREFPVSNVDSWYVILHVSVSRE